MNINNKIKRNSSTILTILGSAGVIASTISAVKATPKAIDILKKYKKEQEKEELNKIEIVKTTIPVYIPTISLCFLTISCILGSNIINKKNQASIISAYVLLDKSFKEYKKNVNDIYGEDSDEKIIEKIVKDKYDKENDTCEDNKVLFFDEFSNRYFRSTSEDVLKAEYSLNKKVLSNLSCACLNDFYELLGLEKTDYGDKYIWDSSELWDCYWSSWVDFYHEKVEMDDGLECTIIRFTEPIAEFID